AGVGCFFASRRRHTSFSRDWSSDVCSSDLHGGDPDLPGPRRSAGAATPWRTRGRTTGPDESQTKRATYFLFWIDAWSRAARASLDRKSVVQGKRGGVSGRARGEQQERRSTS